MPLFRTRLPGEVEFLDDEPSNDNSTSPPQDVQENAPRALLLHEAEKGLEATKNIRDTAAQSHEVAVATASSLSAQTRQLEGIADQLDEVDNTVDKAGQTVHKLTRNPLRALVEKPFSRSKRREKAVKLSGQSVLPSSSKRSQSSTGDQKEKANKPSTWLSRRKEELLGNSTKQGDGHLQTVDSYSDIKDDEVKQILRKQDDYLDETAQQLSELQRVALGMNEEIEKQAEIVDSIDAPEITTKIRYNNQKLKRKLKL
ncbi:hypothetical protein BWQ96_08084 [Gracilariopsis chorda]|uniref:t-SNARE coiled-coil homology domain-containing protein n=1 Tax=Gracilariopsis chorda TaxID=448386 RepID=A0A2V3IJ97_9FLOR|nr:hypothetical protein BWQ96_08084 [Gracilariopsis chorda]|eukprot:PXF42164.1 hypothetical protein BWQ96_08084 [Gracilariopsis chorda]